ncbi:formylglycine-generating enzyme family protein [Leucobacter luti]|nr:formylglycine-generating enzyme family protein [Leucobacter luti]MBL3700504.1 formylglycine-generating enzyme family protein [Leucobacter luti]
MQWVPIPGGEFLMGSEEYYPDEAPQHRRKIKAFSLSATPVTNEQFAAFVAETSYVTIAERPLPSGEYQEFDAAALAPGSLVFTPTRGPVDLRDWQQWWRWVPGACWHRPAGPESTLDGIADHPVVHIAYADAMAYASWVGARLPSEAEFEFAACGGATPTPYAWGSVRDPGGIPMANTWRGYFPFQNDGARGWKGTSPVGSFPPNAYGVYDCIGNVWEWCSDLYTSSHRSSLQHHGPNSLAVSPISCGCGCGPSASLNDQPAGNAGMVQRVLKGGSHLCAPKYCLRYRPAARSPQAEDSATTHIGFRVARDGS